MAATDVEIGQIPVDGRGQDQQTPLTITWQDIRYSVKISDGFCKGSHKKEILHGLNGAVQPGESLAILGSSGAGKSTLLDILANRIRRRSFQGTVRVNGSDQLRQFRRQLAYVPQADTLFARLSVEESLLYSARLRLPSSVNAHDRVNETLKQLGLESVRKTKIGNDSGIRGVSGGERRRASIGMELVTRPRALLLDEPTSGLDSAAALSCGHLLKELSQKGHTVIATLHQPSAPLLNCFTHVLFLADGRIVYHGPVSELRSYFSSIDHPMPPDANPADFILELVTEQKKSQQLERLCEQYESSSLARLMRERGQQQGPAAQIENLNYPRHGHKQKEEKPRGWLWQLLILTHRNALLAFRSPELVWGRVALFVIMSLILGTLFWRVGEKRSLVAARQVESFVVFSVAMACFTSLQALPIFLDEREIYKRERGSGYYNLLPYTLALLIVQLPVLAVLAIIYSSIGYWLVALAPDAGAFFFFVFVMFCTLLAAQSLVLLISSIVPNFGAGNGLGSALFALMFLFSGFFIVRSDIPGWWIWFHWISIFKYPLEANMQNQFVHSGAYNVCADGVSRTVNTMNMSNCMRSGYALMDFLRLAHDINRFVLMAILLGFALVYRVLFYFVLLLFITPQRK